MSEIEVRSDSFFVRRVRRDHERLHVDSKTLYDDPHGGLDAPNLSECRERDVTIELGQQRLDTVPLGGGCEHNSATGFLSFEEDPRTLPECGQFFVVEVQNHRGLLVSFSFLLLIGGACCFCKRSISSRLRVGAR